MFVRIDTQLILVLILSYGHSVALGGISHDVISLEAGSTAPHSGFLVGEDRFFGLIETELKAAQLNSELAIEKRLRNSLEAMYSEKLAEAVKSPKWHQTPEINRWLGFTLGVLVTVAAFYGGSQLIKTLQ